MQENVSFKSFSGQMEISIPRDNCFGGNSAEPRYPPNTVIHRDGFDSFLKPLKYTYTKATLYKRSVPCTQLCPLLVLRNSRDYANLSLY